MSHPTASYSSLPVGRLRRDAQGRSCWCALSDQVPQAVMGQSVTPTKGSAGHTHLEKQFRQDHLERSLESREELGSGDTSRAILFTPPSLGFPTWKPEVTW